MVLTGDAAYFLASKKKIEFLQKVEGTENGVTVKLMTRDKVNKLELPGFIGQSLQQASLFCVLLMGDG